MTFLLDFLRDEGIERSLSLGSEQFELVNFCLSLIFFLRRHYKMKFDIDPGYIFGLLLQFYSRKLNTMLRGGGGGWGDVDRRMGTQQQLQGNDNIGSSCLRYNIRALRVDCLKGTTLDL